VLPLQIYQASSEAAQDVLDSMTSSQLDRALIRPHEKSGEEADFGVLKTAQIGADVHQYIGVMRATEDTSAATPDESGGPVSATSAVQAARAALSSAIQAATSMGAQPGISAAVVALARRESGATAVEAYNLPDPAKVSMGDLRRLPLPIQVGIVMKRAMILPLEDVKRFTREDASDDILVSHLLQYARPVRGLWVLSSQHWVTLPDALHLLAGDSGLDQRAVRVAYETLARESRENAEEEAAAAAAAAGNSRRRGGAKKGKGGSNLGLAAAEEETDPDAVTVEHPVGLHMEYRPDLLGPIARTTMQGIARLVAVRDYVLMQLQARGGSGEAGVHLAQLQSVTGAATSTLRSILKSLGRVRGGAVGPPKHSHIMAVTFGAGVEAAAVQPPVRNEGDAAWHLPGSSTQAEAFLRNAFPGMLAQQEESWERRTAALEALFGQSAGEAGGAAAGAASARHPHAAAMAGAGGLKSASTAAGDARLLEAHVEAARCEIASLLHKHRVCSVRYLASALRVTALRQLQESGDLSTDLSAVHVAAGSLDPQISQVAATAAARGTPPLAALLSHSRDQLHLAVATLVRGGSAAQWSTSLTAVSEAHIAALSAMPLELEASGEFIGMNALEEDGAHGGVEALEGGGTLPLGTPSTVAAIASRMAFAAPSTTNAASGGTTVARSRDAVVAEFARGALSLQRRQIISAIDAAEAGAGSALTAGQYKALMTELASSQRGLGWLRKSGEYDDVPLQWQ